MVTTMRFLLAAVILLFLIPHAQAQFLGEQVRHVLSGKPLRIWTVYNINPDCTLAGNVQHRVTRPPRHGRIFVSSRSVFPQYPSWNDRSACNRRRVPGVELSYVSQRGYTGPDSVFIEFIHPGGQLNTLSLSINVR